MSFLKRDDKLQDFFTLESGSSSTTEVRINCRGVCSSPWCPAAAAACTDFFRNGTPTDTDLFRIFFVAAAEESECAFTKPDDKERQIDFHNLVSTSLPWWWHCSFSPPPPPSPSMGDQGRRYSSSTDTQTDSLVLHGPWPNFHNSRFAKPAVTRMTRMWCYCRIYSASMYKASFLVKSRKCKRDISAFVGEH